MRWKKARSFISIASSGLNFPGKLSYVHVETEYANQMWVPKILAASEQMEPFWACSLQSANPCKIIFQLCCKKGAADKQRHPFCSTRLIYFFKLCICALKKVPPCHSRQEGTFFFLLGMHFRIS